jgi:alpha-tubulin suppressor-like RCC1 family protein
MANYYKTLSTAVLIVAAFAGWAHANTLSGGSQHTVVVTPDGSVWTWGGNTYGQLGDGSTTARRVPEAVPLIVDAIAVAAGSFHTLVLLENGTVLSWGYNAYGQLGDGSTSQRTEPVPVSGLTGVVAIAAGPYHSVALTSSGQIYTWGLNSSGQLGDGTTTTATQPVLVTTLSGMTAIATGDYHGVAVKSDGTVWAWGGNSYGQLGDASTTWRTSPVQMSGITGAASVAAGGSHTLVLKTDGTVRATGYNFSGQLGDGTATHRTSTVAVGNLSGVLAIEAGNDSSYALKNDGTVWAWGSNSGGRLGDGTLSNRSTAVQTSVLAGITALGAGNEFGIAVSSTGVVSTWGVNVYGTLGDGTLVDRPTPVAISEANYAWKVGTPVFSVAAGTYSTEKTVVITCATPDAIIHYTLNGETPTESDPVIASGASLVIDETRTLKARAWKTGMAVSTEASATYTLAVATVTLSPTPTTYTTAQNVSMSTSSPGVTIRYTIDGSTPTASSTAYTSPIAVGTTTTVKAVGFRSNWTSSGVTAGTYTMNFGTLTAPGISPGTGTYTSQALVTLTSIGGATIRYTTNGTAVTPSSPIYTEPVAVTATSTLNVRAYHPDYAASPQAGANYTIVVAAPQLSHTSGTYPAGQVIAVTSPTSGATLRYTLHGGTPTISDAIVPAGGIVAGNFTLKVGAWKTGATPSSIVTATYSVTGSAASPSVAANGAHSLAVRGDGTFWAWGWNSTAQLGDGTTTNRPLPTIVSGISGAVAAAAGADHSLAVRSDGTAWAWGSNWNGQVGDGTTTMRSLPTVVTALTNIVAVAGGTSYSLALKSDGTVWGWGNNAQGQLGDSTTTQRLTPVQTAVLANITRIATGSTFSFAVASDGSVWSWGGNPNGQLGTGNTTSRSTPGQVLGISTGTQVAAGSSHGLALLSDGSVRSWGYNGFGQLGDGSTTQRSSPVTVTGLSGVSSIAAGQNHSLALTSSGIVWAWGNNGQGQLGDGTQTNRISPVTVQGLPLVVAIAAGEQHSLAVALDGSVWAWGRNNRSQLGDGTTVTRVLPVAIAGPDMSWKVPTPVLSVPPGTYLSAQNVTVTCGDLGATLHYTLNGSNPTQGDPVVVSGASVAITLSATLKVRAWKPGAVSSEVSTATYELKVVAPLLSPGTGQYGSAQNVAMSTTTPGATLRYTLDGTEPGVDATQYSGPITVAETRTVKARAFKAGWTSSDSSPASYWISAGTVATPTIAPGGGPLATVSLVTLASTTTGATIRYTLDGSDPTPSSPRYTHSLLVVRTTTVKARGYLMGFTPSSVATATYVLDPAGQLALPSISPAGGRFATKQTVIITGPAGATLRYTTTGIDPVDTDSTIASGGTLVVDRAQIVKVRAWQAGSTPSAVQRADFLITGAVAAGQQHSLALSADGVVRTWGRGLEGQIGDGTSWSRVEPTAVFTDAVGIAGGQYFSLAVRADGTVWAWGSNGYGQLGDGTTTQRTTPVQVVGLSGVIAVAAGWQHSIALKSDGSVWAWGDNAYGQLGDGTTISRSSPVQVLGATGVTAIAAGEGFSMALQRDGAAGGSVWTWGLNTYGQLGDGSVLNRAVPVRVPGVADAAGIAAGRAFGVMRTVSGSARAWGRNETAQLGNVTGVSSLSPTALPVLSTTLSVSAGANHALATTPSGRVWGWGTTANSQLGTLQYFASTGVGTPILVPGITGVVGTAAGWQQTLLVRADGTVWAAGSTISTGLGGETYTTIQQIPGLSLAPNAWLLTDGDGDGLPAWQEYLVGVDPLLADSNGNGLSDAIDVARNGPLGHPDDDGDGVPNVLEIARGTDPFEVDTDGDTVSDLLDDYPLDPTRSQKPPPNPLDTTPPVIILIYPTTAVPIGGGL